MTWASDISFHPHAEIDSHDWLGSLRAVIYGDGYRSRTRELHNVFGAGRERVPYKISKSSVGHTDKAWA